MQIKKIMQWAILAVCLAASALNILYLIGVLSQHAATYGFLLVLGCFAANLLLKGRYGDASAASSKVDQLRGIATAVFAVVWLVTTGIAFVWLK